MTKQDFKQEESALRRQLLDMRFDLKNGKLTNTASLKKTRRDLARLLTLMRQNNG
ncbi:MAG: 50S ribosomal protein L29 [Myxococcaceae bacterium]